MEKAAGRGVRMGSLIKKETVPLGEILYGLSFVTLLFAKGIGLYDGQKLFFGFVLLSLFFGVCKLLSSKYSWKDLALIAAMTIAALMIYMHSREKGILFYVWMMIGLKNVKLETVMRWGWKIWSLSFGGAFVYFLFHLSDSMYQVDAKLGLGHIFRWGMGQPHPNVLHISYLLFLLFTVYQLGEKWSGKIGLAMFAGNCYIFLYSASYTGFFIVTVYLAANWHWKCRGKFGKIEQAVCECFFPLCVLASVAGPLVLKGRLFEIINKLLTSRLYLSGLFLKRENIKLFGNHVGSITNAVETMDSSYVYGLIAYGVLFFAAMTAGYLCLIHKYVKEQKGLELLMIFAMLAAGLTEPFLFNTSYKNISFLFMGSFLFAFLGKGGAQEDRFLLRFRGKAPEEIPVSIVRIDWQRVMGRMQMAAERKRGVLFGFSAAAGLVCAALYLAGAPDYRGVVVPRVHCTDIEKGTSLYLTEENRGEYEGYLIWDYKNGETPMECFEGNIIKVEKVRGGISRGMLGYAVCYGVISMSLWGVSVRKARKEG